MTTPQTNKEIVDEWLGPDGFAHYMRIVNTRTRLTIWCGWWNPEGENLCLFEIFDLLETIQEALVTPVAP